MTNTQFNKYLTKHKTSDKLAIASYLLDKIEQRVVRLSILCATKQRKLNSEGRVAD